MKMPADRPSRRPTRIPADLPGEFARLWLYELLLPMVESVFEQSADPSERRTAIQDDLRTACRSRKTVRCHGLAPLQQVYGASARVDMSGKSAPACCRALLGLSRQTISRSRTRWQAFVRRRAASERRAVRESVLSERRKLLEFVRAERRAWQKHLRSPRAHPSPTVTVSVHQMSAHLVMTPTSRPTVDDSEQHLLAVADRIRQLEHFEHQLRRPPDGTSVFERATEANYKLLLTMAEARPTWPRGELD